MAVMRIESFRTKYIDEPAILKQAHYGDGSIALLAFSELGEPLFKLTVCLQEYGQKPRDGHVFIKVYAENEGVLEALQAAGVVGEPVRSMDVGFATDGAYECPLLVEIDD